jgi:CheY-like chemotaxis protein
MKSVPVPTVFIVNDDAGMRQAVQDLVESVGLHAESFSTGEEFLKKQRTPDPSCLVLDVRLPQMSGLDFQRQLAEIGLQIPIIFITAHGDIPMSVKVLKSGAHVRMRLKTGDGNRETATRVQGIFADRCPVYRSLKPAIAMTTELIFEPLDE